MSIHTPLISIITVSYNASATIEATIKSVLSQTFKNFEYIIVDGDSTDGTKELIKEYASHLSYWISEPDKGIYDAMNKAVGYAKGQFVYFIGADDIFIDSGVLEKVQLYLIDKTKIYYGNVFFKKRQNIYDGKFNAIKLVTRNISHQSIFYPRSVFDVFHFNTRYNIFADYDLNLKLYNTKQYDFCYINVLISLFNDQGSSGSNNIDYNFEMDRLDIIKSNFNYFIYLYRVIRTKVAKFIY